MTSVFRCFDLVAPKSVVKGAIFDGPSPTTYPCRASDFQRFSKDEVGSRGQSRLKRDVFTRVPGLIFLVRAPRIGGGVFLGEVDQLNEVSLQAPHSRLKSTAGPLHQGGLKKFHQYHSVFIDIAPCGRRRNPRLVAMAGDKRGQIKSETFNSLHPVTQVGAAQSLGAAGLVQNRPYCQSKRDEGAGALKPGGKAAVRLNPGQCAAYRRAVHKGQSNTVRRQAEGGGD